MAKIAEDLGIAESCLRNWVKQADIDDGGADGLIDRRAGRAGGSAPGAAHREDGDRDPEACGGVLRQGEHARPKMMYTFIARACTDLPVAACCRVMKVSTSGFYAWQANPVSDRDLDDALLTNTIVDIHRDAPAFLWLAEGPRRAAPRPGHPVLAEARRAAHARSGHLGHLSPPAPGLHAPGPGRRTCR